MSRLIRLALLGSLFLPCFMSFGQEYSGSPIQLDRIIELPGIQGGFDHFAFDRSTGQLFLAASDQGTIAAIELKDGQVRRIGGFTNPHSILVQPNFSRLLVTDSGPGASAFVDTKKLAVIRKLQFALGANCVLDDPQKHRAYVTAGGDRVHQTDSTLQLIDSDTGGVLVSTHVAALHLQPMALDPSTDRLFVNLADQDAITIYDRNTLRTLETWKLPVGHRNSPIVLDLRRHRLFVVATYPGILMELNSETGALKSSIATPGIPDDIGYDDVTERIYVPGDGALAVFDASGSEGLRLLQQVKTGPSARTGMLIPSERRFVVAVPSPSVASSAQVMVFKIDK